MIFSVIKQGYINSKVFLKQYRLNNNNKETFCGVWTVIAFHKFLSVLVLNNFFWNVIKKFPNNKQNRHILKPF